MSKKLNILDAKVIIHSNKSRAITITKIIPIDWRYVRITKLSEDENSITVKITKLLGSEIDQ